jgi:hypothetical protein
MSCWFPLMLDVIRENDIHNWQARFVDDLQHISPRSEESRLRGALFSRATCSAKNIVGSCGVDVLLVSLEKG